MAYSIKSIIYEVNVSLDPAIRDDYCLWLKGHIAEILALPGFEKAETLQQIDAAPGQIQLSIRYFVRSQSDLERYLSTDAPRLRADAESRFGGKFKASRRVLATYAAL